MNRPKDVYRDMKRRTKRIADILHQHPNVQTNEFIRWTDAVRLELNHPTFKFITLSFRSDEFFEARFVRKDSSTLDPEVLNMSGTNARVAAAIQGVLDYDYDYERT